MNPKLLIAGGGTGGHIMPGLAIAEAWKKKFSSGPNKFNVKFNVKSNVKFVGARGALEERLVPKAGYPLYRLWIGALNRVSVFQKLKTYFLLPISMLQSALILLIERPQWVLGVGGYSSGPFLLIASTFGRILGVKTALLEPNSVPGYTNRKLARRVDVVFVSFENAKKFFPGDRIVRVGTPIRKDMRPLMPAPRDPFTIFIFGGSQGAVGMNSVVLEALPHLKNCSFIHQTGTQDFERVSKVYSGQKMNARVHEFIDDMISCYQAASLVIARAGASTLAEISSVGRAAILIPLPTSADNHQLENAREFEATGGGIVLEQSESASGRLCELIDELKKNLGRLAEMESKSKNYHRPDAPSRIVEEMVRRT